MRFRVAVLACGVLSLSRGVIAAAQTPATDERGVQLSIPDCEDIPGTQIAKLVELELAPHASTVADDARGTFTRASVRCAADRATITVDDPGRLTPLVLELALSDVRSEARPRFLALAVAELIATSRLEREARAREPKPEPPAPAPEPEPEPPPQLEPSDRFELFLQGGAARGFEPALFAPALSLGVARGFRPFALIFDASYERAQTTTAEATVTAHNISLSAAPAWKIALRSVELALALGLRAGYAHLGAQARSSALSGHTLSGIFLLPISQASVQLRLAPAWAARFAFELGYVLKPVRGNDADGVSLLELRGLHMAAQLGIAWTL
jgi:hypothetical protein